MLHRQVVSNPVTSASKCLSFSLDRPGCRLSSELALQAEFLKELEGRAEGVFNAQEASR